MIDVAFPYMYPWQKDVFDPITTDNGRGNTYVVKAKRQVGKSILAISVLLFFAFRNNGSIGVMVEPVMHQCRRVFRQLVNAIGGEESPLIKSANATLLEITFTNNSQIIFKSQEQGETLRGLTVKNSVLVLDEAAYLTDDTFFMLDPAVDATKSPTLIISTPCFKNGEFYERYTRGVKGSDFVQSFNWSDYDTSVFLTPEKLEYYRQTMNPLKFRSEILGEFIEEGSYLFGDFKHIIGTYSTKPSIFAGVDWGSVGTDSTVIIFFDDDRQVTDIKRWTGMDPVEMVDLLADEIKKHPALKTVQVEANSIGEIYFSMLKRKVRNGLIRKFNTTNDSKRRIIEQFIAAVQQGKVTIPNHPELIKQMQHYGAEKTPGGKVTYNGMDNVHDDCVMAISIGYDLFKDNNNSGFSIAFA